MRKPTIYEALRDKLGREPTHNELVKDVERILREAGEEQAAVRYRRQLELTPKRGRGRRS